VINWKHLLVGVTGLFNVGDKVFYPMHGAGVIEAIEEREILGEKRTYYVMHIPVGNMKVMIPMNSAEKVGLREVIDEEAVSRVLAILRRSDVDLSDNWNRRYRAHLDKMKSGDIFEVADVVRNLMLREREKGLSTGERRMLENARQILISELVLAKGIDEREAAELVEACVENRNTAL